VWGSPHLAVHQPPGRQFSLLAGRGGLLLLRRAALAQTTAADPHPHVTFADGSHPSYLGCCFLLSAASRGCSTRPRPAPPGRRTGTAPFASTPPWYTRRKADGRSHLGRPLTTPPPASLRSGEPSRSTPRVAAGARSGAQRHLLSPGSSCTSPLAAIQHQTNHSLSYPALSTTAT